jgi:large subunit ribosomal protein L3
LRELAAENVDAFQVGDQVSCEAVFKAGDIVDVTGTSKGKGYQGVIKRWNFAGGPGGHGSNFHRRPGSIGCSAWPSRVRKGMKMAGQMGNRRVTTQNLEIVEVRPEQNLILVKGALPGANQGLVVIRKGIKVK